MAMTLAPTSAVDPGVAEAMQVYLRLQAVRNALAPDLNDVELQLFAMVAERSRLDPFAKQIYAIKRGNRLTFQAGIDGFRSSAEETNEYRGSDEPEFGPIIERPFPHPEWARVVVHRQYPDGSWLHQPATVYWDEFYPGDQQGAMWKKMPRNQLAKCGEAAAFRKAFPKRFGQVYTPEEMHQADDGPLAGTPAPTARERAQQRLAEVVTDAPAPSQEPGAVPEQVAAGHGTTAPEPRPGTGPGSPGEEPDAPASASPSPAQCGSMSPYEPSSQCQKEQGHTGNHANRERESW